MHMKPTTPLKNIPLIQAKYLKPLEKLGLKNVRDFLFYFPFRYQDFSQIVEISPEHINRTITVEGKIIKTKINRIFKRRMSVQEIVIEGKNEKTLKAVWFNQPFILETLKEGTRVRLSGKLELKGRTLTLTSPQWEKASREATNTARLVPVYSETRGITSKWIRWQIQNIFKKNTSTLQVVPESITKKFNLFSVSRALREIHFPKSQNALLVAQKTFAFQDMFLAQVNALKIEEEWKKQKAIAFEPEKEMIEKFKASLPFELTKAQKKSAQEILFDIEKEKPMNRLLNGDVGSGKTVVASIAALEVAQNKYQMALMAPTEVLARQHFESFLELFKDYTFNIGLLSNSYKIEARRGEQTQNDRKKMLKKISKGEIDIVIGTHAIIQKDVHFKKLALIVIDEQHRFGVAQRATLQNQVLETKDGSAKTIPHLLTMTATPIPRTLAISYFGSLEISLLDEMPRDRQEIETKIVTPKEQERVYEFSKKEIEKGRQIFIIFPLIEESKALSEVKAAKEEFERLSKKVFLEYKLALLHGRMKSEEKERVMRKFKDKKFDILVSTSVVEVGVDIPNASVMIIENSERFGLSQLHQFRGRVGRGKHNSFCFLFVSRDEKRKNPRLRTLEKTNDGFQIAEKDLKLRGPGQFFGRIQSGLPDQVMQNLGNIRLIKLARSEATNLLKKDPKFEKYPEIKKALERFQESVHLE